MPLTSVDGNEKYDQIGKFTEIISGSDWFRFNTFNPTAISAANEYVSVLVH